jgi:phosphoribosylglycinamide formyltransferase 2
MTDAAALRALIEAERPHLIVPEIEAIATDELVRMEAEGLATVIPTARAAQLTMNREGIRRLAAETLGLPTSTYAFASSEAELAEAAARVTGFPCFVKPVMSSSGKGQSFVEGPDGIAAAWRYALEGGRVEQPRVIVEGRVDFDFEITQLTVRSLGADGQVRTDFCAPIGHRQVKGDYVESWQPQAMTPAALKSAQDVHEAASPRVSDADLMRGGNPFLQGGGNNEAARRHHEGAHVGWFGGPASEPVHTVEQGRQIQSGLCIWPTVGPAPSPPAGGTSIGHLALVASGRRFS